MGEIIAFFYERIEWIYGLSWFIATLLTLYGMALFAYLAWMLISYLSNRE